jgi:endonuclease/exonuclease/phosphatase family metal-dependent hydrolase
MTTRVRIASFNVENLFSRAKVFNLRDKGRGDQILGSIEELDSLLRLDTYTETVKGRILELYRGETTAANKLKDYIEIREDRGKLFSRKGRAVVGVAAGGREEWDGAIEFRRAPFSEVARGNTAKVIKAVRADVACIVEAEDRPTLVAFNREMLGSRKFKCEMLIDGNDPRGIDVALLSNFPLRGMQTHIFDGTTRSRIFSRDCLEVVLEMPDGVSLHVLCNHFKSRGYGEQAASDARRRRQAERVTEILGKYNLKKDRIVVAGDLNDSPGRPPETLLSILEYPDLFDVLALQFPNDQAARWTYHYKAFEQIDYLLVSKALKPAFMEAGVERRGIYRLEKLTGGGLKEFDSVTHWSDAASDHGAVWAEFAF